MIQNFIDNSKDLENGFREYLNLGKNNTFILDLSSSTIIECIDKMCEIKSWSHPNIRKNYKMLINKIKNIESLFECTITPAMINSVFWNYFVPFLTK